MDRTDLSVAIPLSAIHFIFLCKEVCCCSLWNSPATEHEEGRRTAQFRQNLSLNNRNAGKHRRIIKPLEEVNNVFIWKQFSKANAPLQSLSQCFNQVYKTQSRSACHEGMMILPEKTSLLWLLDYPGSLIWVQDTLAGDETASKLLAILNTAAWESKGKATFLAGCCLGSEIAPSAFWC